MTDYEYLLFEVSGRVAWLTLNRPEKLNAFNGRMEREMLDAIEAAGRDREARVLVLTGAGRGFCAGHDLADLAGETPPQERVQGVNRTAVAVYELDKPVIAAVNGVAAGGGYALALACDIRVASEDARFLEIHVARGIVPGAESWFLPRIVGMSRASELIFSGREVGAEEADRIGLVSKVVGRDDLAHETRALADDIARKPQQSLAYAKKALHAAMESGLSAALDYVGLARAVVSRSGETQDHARAFLSRAPES